MLTIQIRGSRVVHQILSTVQFPITLSLSLLQWSLLPHHSSPGMLIISLAQSCWHSREDLLQLGVSVNISVSILLAVQQSPVHHLHLQPARGVRRPLPRHLHLVPELVLKLLLQLAELGGVPSPTTTTKIDWFLKFKFNQPTSRQYGSSGASYLKCLNLTKFSLYFACLCFEFWILNKRKYCIKFCRICLMVEIKYETYQYTMWIFKAIFSRSWLLVSWMYLMKVFNNWCCPAAAVTCS